MRFSHKASLCGITRVADISSLDVTCLPVATAIRPTAKTLQVSNGKGLTIDAAKVSAMMEGIEIFHAESNSGLEIHKRSIQECKSDSCYYVHEKIENFEIPTNWLRGKCYFKGDQDNIYVSEIDVLMYNSYLINTSNGLASGNCYEEAVIHGLYELVVRDGNTEVEVCSNRGLCQTLTGECQCFPNFLSQVSFPSSLDSQS